MYVEQTISRVLKYAAAAGEIPHLVPEEIYTDYTAEPEWNGRGKLYVLREESNTIADLSDGWGGSGIAESTLTVAAIGADKRKALETITAATEALRAYLPPEAPEDPDAEGESVEIDADETLEVGLLEILNTGTFTAAGEVTGDGWIVAETVEGALSPSMESMTGYPIISWTITGASGVERFENGAFREQYYQTRQFKAIHNLEI